MHLVTAKSLENLKLGRVKGLTKKGHIHSEAERQKRIATLKEFYKNNPDVAKKRGLKLRGENHYQWKGGITLLNKSIRTMTENRKWMDAVKARDGKCLYCGSVEELESDHIKPLAEILKEFNITDRETARECSELWDINNGRTLCRKCHYKKDNRKYSKNGQGRRKLIQQNASRITGII